jgi:hypothetical protein
VNCSSRNAATSANEKQKNRYLAVKKIHQLCACARNQHTEASKQAGFRQYENQQQRRYPVSPRAYWLVIHRLSTVFYPQVIQSGPFY